MTFLLLQFGPELVFSFGLLILDLNFLFLVYKHFSGSTTDDCLNHKFDDNQPFQQRTDTAQAKPQVQAPSFEDDRDVRMLSSSIFLLPEFSQSIPTRIASVDEHLQAAGAEMFHKFQRYEFLEVERSSDGSERR